MNKEKPLISVIVPVYKVEQYLHRCVDSILAQTYTNLEIILIDDGSPDRSGEICDEYAAKDSRIRVIHQENAGVSAARNAGLDACTGDYLTFLDSDDYLDDTLFDACVIEIRKHTPDLIDYGFRFVDANGAQKRTQMHTLPKHTPIYRSEIKARILPQLIHTKGMDSDFPGAWITNKLFLSDYVKLYHIRFDPQIRLWEDGIFTIEYMQYVNVMVCLDKVCYNYRDTVNSLSMRYDPDLYLYAIRIYEKYRAIYADAFDFENDVASNYRFELAHGIIMRTMSFLSNNVITKRETRALITQMLCNPVFARYLTGMMHRNPVISFVQALLHIGCPRLAAELYLLYRILIEWKHRW